jgi:uncharacterized protein (UPF0332 family)
MDDRIIDLSRYRMEKAKEDLSAARLLLDSGLFKQSINRSYYSIFHASRALLAYDRLDSRKHSGIISFFNITYIKPGKIDYKYFRIIVSAEEIRNDSDYDDFFTPGREQVVKQIQDAEEFINAIESYIQKTYKM